MSDFAPYSSAPSSFVVSLRRLGWRTFFQAQLGLDELQAVVPARVVAVHRSGPRLLTEKGLVADPTIGAAPTPPAGGVTVGDWLLLEPSTLRPVRVLERESAFVRLAAGRREAAQAVAANVDSLFVVSSCNHDFNPARLERYLALAAEAHVQPVLVLTKRDLAADDGADYVRTARNLAPRVEVFALNATRADEVLRELSPWLGIGQTVAFVGSSGVGKSTLVNALLARPVQETRGIREDDSKGRHTTTARRMLLLPHGAWLIDTPGMRELKIGGAEEGVAAVFEDVAALAAGCRYRDCRHREEKGCAVQAAIAQGRLDPRRLASYVKLENEARRASEPIWQRHERAKRLGRLYKSVQRGRRDGREP